jgi:hypothetical protein
MRWQNRLVWEAADVCFWISQQLYINRARHMRRQLNVEAMGHVRRDLIFGGLWLCHPQEISERGF